MPELDADKLMQDTNVGLVRLVEETEKKAKLELERINLERERIARQQEILEKEEHHNAQLDRLVFIVEELNSLLKVMIKSSLDQLQDRIYRIYSIQEALLHFLLREYDKIRDREQSATESKVRDLLAAMKSDTNFTVAGSVQSSRDVNLNSQVNSNDSMSQDSVRVSNAFTGTAESCTSIKDNSSQQGE